MGSDLLSTGDRLVSSGGVNPISMQEPTLAKDANSPAHMREHIKDLAKQLAEQATARESAERALEQAERRVEFLNTVEKRAQELEHQLSDARDESELHLAFTRELLTMLGRKSQRRNAARLREIRIAIARYA